MVNNYKIIVDASLDLPMELIKEYDLEVIPMKFTINNKEYTRYFDDRELSSEEFNKILTEGNVCQTTQINPLTFEETCKKYLEQGIDVIICPFSQGLSGTFNSAFIASNTLKEEYPNRQIGLINCLQASASYSLVIQHIYENKVKGLTIEENVIDTHEFIKKVLIYFTVDDLDTLIRGGRLSKTKGTFAKLLNIKPVLNIDITGHLQPVGKTSGRKKVLNELINKLVKTYTGDETTDIFVVHANCLNEAIPFAEKIKQTVKCRKVYVSYMSPIINAHTGQGCMAVSYIGNRIE